MNRDEIEKDFENWFQTNYNDAMQFRNWDTCEYLCEAKPFYKEAWIAYGEWMSKKVEEKDKTIFKLVCIIQKANDEMAGKRGYLFYDDEFKWALTEVIKEKSE